MAATVYANEHAQVHSCALHDAIYTVQENGCVTLRVAKTKTQSTKVISEGACGARVLTVQYDVCAEIDTYQPSSLHYDSVCASESVRVTKSYRVHAAAASYIDDLRTAVIMTTGKLMMFVTVGAHMLRSNRIAHVLVDHRAHLSAYTHAHEFVAL